MKVFAEEAYSVALHPTGLSMLVGFADKLRLMVVLMDDLRWAGELGCTAAFLDSSALLHGAHAIFLPVCTLDASGSGLYADRNAVSKPLHPVCTLPAHTAWLNKHRIELDMLLGYRGCLGFKVAQA